ncbi:hypothetical protein SMICM304S_01165 [Streptomyces microflavus]
MPRAAAASNCSPPTASTPPRTISAAYAAWCSARPRTAALTAPTRFIVSKVKKPGPKGMPNCNS